MTEEKVRTKFGSELNIGDTIKVWWRPGRDRITGKKAYKRSWCADPNPAFDGCWIAEFALLSTGMTIFPSDVFEVIEDE